MAPISEVCAHTCQARIDLLPSMPIAEAKKIIAAWRREHNHVNVTPVEAKSQLGFNLSAVTEDSSEYISDEFDDE